MAESSVLNYESDEADPDLLEEFLHWFHVLDIRTVEVDSNAGSAVPDVFLIGKRSDTILRMEALSSNGPYFVILDNDPPEHVPEGVFCITTADMSGLSDSWKTLLQKVGSKIGRPVLSFQAKEKWEKGSGLFDKDQAQILEAVRQEEYEKAERTTNDFVNAAGVVLSRLLGVEFSKLVEEPTYTEEIGLSFISATYASKRALISQKRAVQELGRSFSHTRLNIDGRQWGRLSWPNANGQTDIVYEGDTDGVNAHGYGVFSSNYAGRKQTYKGQFFNGYRAGFGVGKESLFTWIGAWASDHPDGHGVFLQGSKDPNLDIKLGEFCSPAPENAKKFLIRRNQKMDRRSSQFKNIKNGIFDK